MVDPITLSDPSKVRQWRESAEPERGPGPGPGLRDGGGGGGQPSLPAHPAPVRGREDGLRLSHLSEGLQESGRVRQPYRGKSLE